MKSCSLRGQIAPRRGVIASETRNAERLHGSASESGLRVRAHLQTSCAQITAERSGIRPLTTAIVAPIRGRIRLVDKLRYTERPWQLVKFDYRYRQLRKALEAWARNFNVLDDWLMDLALDCLCPPPWNQQLLFSFPAASAAPRLSLTAWDPTV